MAVSHEIKSQLAKLLATEDLVVEHKKCESAQFNVHTRVLTLPLWEKASNTVYDMLVGHEVGHALFTPDEDWTDDIKVPTQFVNVIEDARIEKLMKRKYAGLAKTFYNGYNELNNKDFFELDGEDLTTFNLADRANLFFKIGSFVDLVFSTAEEQIISMIQKCETFEDVKKVSLVLYEYCKEDYKKEKKEEQEKIESNREPDMDPDGGFFDDFEENDEVKDNEEDTKEPTVKTSESLSSSIRDLVNQGGVENVYIGIPDVDIDQIIASNVDVHKEIDKHFNEQVIQLKDFVPSDIFEEVDEDFVEFKRNAQKEVNYLVKEFECRKSASSYARSSISRTGILDTSNLHSYKFNEDLFKRVNILPDGKNHGLVFILDWSGSMQHVLDDTIKQLYNLIWFCKKVSIPFEVYAFTNEWRRREKDYETGRWEPVLMTPHYKKKEYIFQVEESFSLMNILSSKVNSKDLQHQMRNIWRIASSFRHLGYIHYTYPERLGLSGTPLNEALICLHKILPQFQRKNNLQKVQCIILTDGEANALPYHVMVQRSFESEPYMGMRKVRPDRCFFRDRKIGKTYKFGYTFYEFTDVLIKNLKDNFLSVNFIGIRVLPPREANSFIKRYYKEHTSPYNAIIKDWKKLRSFNITHSSYDAYFGLSSTSLAEDSEFEVEEDATKTQIKRAFIKSLRTKKLNKKVLGEFIELVA